MTKTKALRICAAVASLLALYALAGFVLAPRMLRSALMRDIPKTLDVTPAVGEIHINPFLFRLEIKDFSLAAPGGEKLAGFRRLFVDFELSSIWHRAYSFGNIVIDAPEVNAVVAQDGRLNLLQLSPKAAAATQPPAKESMPRIRIGSFKVRSGVVTYDDRSRPTEFAARLEPINVELDSFTTGAEGGRFTFTGVSKLGERVEWHGHVSVQPMESDGEFQIDGLQAHTIWEYVEDRLSFAVNSGTVDLNATYQFSLRDAVDFKASISKIAVHDLAVKPREASIDWVAVPSLLLSGATVDLSKRQARADSLLLTGVKLATWLEPDGSFNLLKLAEPRPAAAGTAPAPASAAPVQAAAAPPWKVALGEFELRDGSISVEDRTTSPAAKVMLAPISLKVGGASSDLARAVSVNLQTRIDDAGALSASGDITPRPLSANLSLKLDGIDLTALQPYIARHTSMTLLAGRLSGDARVRYGATKPALQCSANISIAGLHTVDNALHDDFINWDRLDLSGIAFQHDPDRLDVELATARKLYARVIIEPDTSLNVKRVLAGPGATVIAPDAPGGTPVAATAPTQTGNTPAPPGPVPRAPPAPPPAQRRMPVAVKKIVLHASQANFTDLSVQPNFSTGIQSIEGTVTGLNSNERSRAKVDIHGAVDAFSPVSITGEVNVLSTSLYTDLAMSFRNMELTIFNPYSGKFAGYNITKGKLTTELHYKVDGRKLDAQHHITVDQLEFGDKTESKDALSLPLKLAVALLKDRNGVIDLNIPVKGTLDDPSFSLGPIVWKLFVTILEKAVTAPFALLGALFGGGPDLQFVDFQPAVADLDAGAADKVGAMVKALNERPQLKIEVPLAAVAELDRPALIEARLQAQIREAQAGGRGRSKATTGSAAPDFQLLDPVAKIELLKQLYAKNVGGELKFPAAVMSIKGKPELAAAQADFLEKELRRHITVDDSALTALGQQRAMAVQQALLSSTGLDPARVFLAENDKAANHDGKVRLELSLK